MTNLRLKKCRGERLKAMKAIAETARLDRHKKRSDPERRRKRWAEVRRSACIRCAVQKVRNHGRKFTGKGMEQLEKKALEVMDYSIYGRRILRAIKRLGIPS